MTNKAKYELRIKESVKRDAKNIPAVIFDRIIAKIMVNLLQNPRKGEPLRGQGRPLWRYRVGDYRVVYAFSDEELWILVVRIAHRSEAYKRMPACPK